MERMPLIAFPDGLLPSEDIPHRSPCTQRNQASAHCQWLHALQLSAEGAAQSALHHRHFCHRQIQGAAYRGTHHKRILQRAVDRQLFSLESRYRHDGFRLNVRVFHELGTVAGIHNHIGMCKPFLHIALARFADCNHIAGIVRRNNCFIVFRFSGTVQSRQRLVFHADQPRCQLCQFCGLRCNASHHISEKSRFIICQNILIQHDLADNFQPRDVLRRNDAHNAFQLLGQRSIDLDNPGMRVFRIHPLGVQHAFKTQISAVFGLSGHLFISIQPVDWPVDCKMLHGHTPPFLC